MAFTFSPFRRRGSAHFATIVARSAMAVAAVLTLAACRDTGGARTDDVLELRGTTMGTTYSVKVVADPSTRGRLAGLVEGELRDVTSSFSTYDERSVVSRFNQERDPDAVHRVGAEFVDLVRMALRVAEATDGAFDPTVLPLVRSYPLRDGDEVSDLPGAAAIEKARARVDYRDLEVVDPDGLRKRRADLELDTNAFAKGYGVDRVAARLEAAGCPDYLVEIGGEVRCGGRKPGRVSWRVGVERPSEDGRRAVAEAVGLDDAALATSGDYRQFVETGDGERVHHIFDPRTGRNPESAVVSVSVRAPNCALADALATALMVVGPNAAAGILSGWKERFGDELGALFLLARTGEDGSPRYDRVEFDW